MQGMSDLLSVVYAIMQDDSDAFWCFCGFMDRMVNPGREPPQYLVLGSDVGEIQFPYGSNGDAPSTRHFKRTHSTYDS